MLRRLAITALATVASLGVAAPAARAEFLVAYGTGMTNCSINAKAGRQLYGLLPYWRIQAKTDCDRAVDQSVRVFIPGSWFDGGTCSGFRAHCFSGEPEESDGFGWIEGMPPRGDVELHVTLRAPAGQGWLGPPQYCQGVGTDSLRCVFTRNVLWSLS
jgi:hypothetical protein